ncbi:hypothetical protein [Kitasatospora albolonga]|uniref:hypothetical protein n=1 Tax=Kitasatospora albolonga TaxID=68173 RepID=UPI0035F01CDA
MRSTATPQRPTPNGTPAPITPGTLPEADTTDRAMACPVCGSGSTYQIMSGRWGCTACGSTWAGGYTY